MSLPDTHHLRSEMIETVKRNILAPQEKQKEMYDKKHAELKKKFQVSDIAVYYLLAKILLS